MRLNKVIDSIQRKNKTEKNREPMRVHFIAIGGSAMHNLALALNQKGYQVTGSDDTIFEPSKGRLAAKGLLPDRIGWDENKISQDIDAVILGMHAQADNPELAKAQKLGLRIYSYPEYLYEQTKDKTRVVIGGSHGKTTITSMILHVLSDQGIDVDYMVGAQLEGFDVMVKLTEENEFVIMEGDEYLSSAIDRRSKFLLYKPNIALISGIAWDHINVFPTFENYIEQFDKFVATIPDGGTIIYNTLDVEVVNVVDRAQQKLKKLAYKIPKNTIVEGTTYLQTEAIGEVPLAVFGDHNLNNMDGARLICNQIGVNDADFYKSIQDFKGASKRLELIIKKDSHRVYKDFAHAPSKVKATTTSVKEQFKDFTVVACLELHTYSSLNQEFLKQYKGALSSADIKIVYYSPEALKIKRLDAISEAYIKKCFGDRDIKVFTNPEQLKAFLEAEDVSRKVYLMMSSGNYGGLNLNELLG